MRKKPNGEFETYERQAAICKAFANPTRLHLLDLLSRGERWAAELQRGLGISKANLSQHLAALRSMDLVRARRASTSVWYTVADPKIWRLLDITRDIYERRVQNQQAQLLASH